MNIIEQVVPDYVEHISDWREYRIPEGHCIIDKDICGCGYTEYCIRPENPFHTILCSPRIILLKNKRDQHKGEDNIVYFEYEAYKKEFIKSRGIRVKDFPKYSSEYAAYRSAKVMEDFMRCSRENKPIRFLCTYDSFHSILEALGDSIRFFRVIVDEFQSIFLDSFFKANVENDFFNTLQGVPNVAYLSATPMLEKYMERLEGFRYLPYYKMVWPESRTTTAQVSERWVSSILEEARAIIDTYKNDPLGRPTRDIGGNKIIQSEEVVFYVNSVAMIKKIILDSKLLPSEVNVICADTVKNRKTISSIKHSQMGPTDRFCIGEIPVRGAHHKMFTFCTRTAYLGADFYNPTAITVVLSDANVQSLVVDIRLDLPQILGRQRLLENPWKNECLVFYKTLDDGSQITKEDFERNVKTKESLSKKLLSEAQSLNYFHQDELDLLLSSVINDTTIETGQLKVYLSRTYDGQVVYNDFLQMAEERAWELCQEDYKSNISVVRSIGDSKYISVNQYVSKTDHIVQGIIRKYRELPRFSDKLQLYCEARERYQSDPGITKRLLVYFKTTPFENYYSHFGLKKCKSVSFKEAELKRLLETESKQNSLMAALYQRFPVNQVYTLKDIKENLKDIYKTLGISKTPKATDLLDYFNIQEKMITDKTTKRRVLCYQIISIR